VSVPQAVAAAELAAPTSSPTLSVADVAQVGEVMAQLGLIARPASLCLLCQLAFVCCGRARHAAIA
jgi:hypothetical protein